ncbi:MAG: OsmC family protein [Bacillota bacterium]
MKHYALDITWIGNRNFHATVDDGPPTLVGKDKPLPTHLLLEALAACGAITLLDILDKMKFLVTRLRVEVKATRPEEATARFQEIHLEYVLSGGPFAPEALERALQLADKYCTVRHSLHPDIRVISSYRIEG